MKTKVSDAPSTARDEAITPKAALRDLMWTWRDGAGPIVNMARAQTSPPERMTGHSPRRMAACVSGVLVERVDRSIKQPFYLGCQVKKARDGRSIEKPLLTSAATREKGT